METKGICPVCGKEMAFSDEPEKRKCHFCGDLHPSYGRCAEGHAICPKCRLKTANDHIERSCKKSRSEDPMELAISLMKDPKIRMHGPEHHFLVPAVLLSVYYNAENDRESKDVTITEARKRAEAVPPGFCGTHGDCGAAVGDGIFISLITEATPLSTREWRLCNLMTSKALMAMANIGGPRCCKRSTFIALLEAADFVEQNLKTKMMFGRSVTCEFHASNKECKRTECPFYPKILVKH